MVKQDLNSGTKEDKILVCRDLCQISTNSAKIEAKNKYPIYGDVWVEKLVKSLLFSEKFMGRMPQRYQQFTNG